MRFPRPLLAGLTVGVALLAPAAQAASARVAAFPTPGSHFASAKTQISLRGVTKAKLGKITIQGSRTGVHDGRLVAHSVGKGVSFFPTAPFAAGETVTVRTGLNIIGASKGDYRLQIPQAGPPLRPPGVKEPADSAKYIRLFHSRHDLQPPRVSPHGRSKKISPGSIFLAPKLGPGANGPMILDRFGGLQWFHPVPSGIEADDFRTQTYRGKPVLTWWEGFDNLGTGNGVGQIYNRRYRKIATVQAGNGFSMDPHEFKLTSRGTALVMSLAPVHQDLSKVGGAKDTIVFDSVVQEVEVKTGLVLFEWHSLDSVPVKDSYIPADKTSKLPYDYFHINSVEQLRGGRSLLISGRNTWAAYKVDRHSTRVDWRLGGRRSSFKLGKGASFAFQHDVRQRPSGLVTMFDNGGMPFVHTKSRAMALRLHKGSAALVRQYVHPRKLKVGSQGDFRVMSNGNAFVGWGASGVTSEFSAGGKLLFDMTMPKVNQFYEAGTLKVPKQDQSYRAIKQPWAGLPTDRAAVAASSDGKTTKVYMSWNGATNVATWRVLGGATPDKLESLGRAKTSGFETRATVKGRKPYIAVQALDAKGKVLSTSAAVASKAAAQR